MGGITRDAFTPKVAATESTKKGRWETAQLRREREDRPTKKQKGDRATEKENG